MVNRSVTGYFVISIRRCQKISIRRLVGYTVQYELPIHNSYHQTMHSSSIPPETKINKS
jgi:hypothetical protein